MITVAFADVAILAASRDQAGKLLQQLTGYIKRSPELREQLRITQRIVHCDRTEGKVAVLAADAETVDGWGGTLALVNELGRHKSRRTSASSATGSARAENPPAVHGAALALAALDAGRERSEQLHRGEGGCVFGVALVAGWIARAAISPAAWPVGPIVATAVVVTYALRRKL